MRIGVSTHVHTVRTYMASKGVYDEVELWGSHGFNALLHHVVAVLIRNTLQHMSLKFLCNPKLHHITHHHEFIV